jgi:hypothetical protein
MDARQLEYFLAIVDHDGFGRAAQHLHIAQPSLSQVIAGLERELGVPLFHRIGRGVVLSPAGRELIGPARQVLRDLRGAVRAAIRLGAGGPPPGAKVARLDSPARLNVALVSRAAPMTPAARGFLAAAHACHPVDHLTELPGQPA